MTKTEFIFPVGYHEFNKDKGINFQLNRYYSMGLARFEDMKEAGQKISSSTLGKQMRPYRVSATC